MWTYFCKPLNIIYCLETEGKQGNNIKLVARKLHTGYLAFLFSYN